MEISQPGIQFNENIVSGNTDIETAVPVFIGFTEKGENKKIYSIESIDDFIYQLGGAPYQDSETSYLYYSVRHYFDNGGGPCFIVVIGNFSQLDTLTSVQLVDLINDDVISNLIKIEEKITLVVFPDLCLLNEYFDLSQQNQINQYINLWSQSWRAISKICQLRQGLFGLLDSPNDVSLVNLVVNDFVTKTTNKEKQKLASYWPTLITDYVDDKGNYIIVPSSSSVAAIIQYTDSQFGVWKAPANVPISHVVKPSKSWSEAQNLFNERGASVNLIRSFSGRGVKVWGCRTLADGVDQIARYIQIRRLISYIECSISNLAHFTVFEPNNEITWIKLKGQITNWLRSLWLQGGLFGSNEDEAFKVVIGLNESMTETDVLTGKLIVNISVAVLSPAEFIRLSLNFETSESHTYQNAIRENRSTVV